MGGEGMGGEGMGRGWREGGWPSGVSARVNNHTSHPHVLSYMPHVLPYMYTHTLALTSLVYGLHRT
jgi:hypothetical protein